MNEMEVIETCREAILLALQIAAPILLIGLVVGVSIALLQALTQVQEVTLVFVPKIMSIFLGLFFFLPSMAAALVAFMEMLADRIVGLGS